MWWTGLTGEWMQRKTELQGWRQNVTSLLYDFCWELHFSGTTLCHRYVQREHQNELNLKKKNTLEILWKKKTHKTKTHIKTKQKNPTDNHMKIEQRPRYQQKTTEERSLGCDRLKINLALTRTSSQQGLPHNFAGKEVGGGGEIPLSLLFFLFFLGCGLSRAFPACQVPSWGLPSTSLTSAGPKI